MIPEQLTKTAIKTWVDRISRIDEASGMPECPFAREAWNRRRVHIHNIENGFLLSQCAAIAASVRKNHLFMVVFDTTAYSADRIAEVAEELNSRTHDILFLATHPDSDSPSHPTLGVIFIQHKSEMVEAVNKLRKTTYYDNEPLPEWYTG